MTREFVKIHGREARSIDGIVRVEASRRDYWTIYYKDKKIRLGKEGVQDTIGFLSLVEPPTTRRRWELLDGVGDQYGTEGELLTAEDCLQIIEDFEAGAAAIGERWLYGTPEDSPLPFMRRR